MRYRLARLSIAAALASTLLAFGMAQAQIPRQSAKVCKGQPELRPLEPLQVLTKGGRQAFMVEIADSSVEREYGLMCRRALAPDRGMLFVFDRPEPQAFWMRNTLIALDIVYLDARGRVVSISRNARPLDETPLPSGGASQYVLEIAAGRATQIGLQIGDQVVQRTIRRG